MSQIPSEQSSISPAVERGEKTKLSDDGFMCFANLAGAKRFKDHKGLLAYLVHEENYDSFMTSG